MMTYLYIPTITLWQPWAAFMALGIKQVETRSWGTDYRGPLVIHAAKRKGYWTPELRAVAEREASDFRHWFNLRGVVLGMGYLYDVKPTEKVSDLIQPTERLLGDYSDGRFAWGLRGLTQFEKLMRVRGYQRIWRWRDPPEWAIEIAGDLRERFETNGG